MLDELSTRINLEVQECLALRTLSANEKRSRIFEIVTGRNEIVAICFDDWRRSQFMRICIALVQHQLLRAEHVTEFTTETQTKIEDDLKEL